MSDDRATMASHAERAAPQLDSETGLSGLLELDEEIKAGLRILIIDDDRSLCDSCAAVLTGEGFGVEVCYRGVEGRRRLERGRFDIVLVDLYMSQVTGMELLRACQELQPHALAIVITGRPSVTSSLEALRAGAWDYLPKPFSGSHLLVLIGRAAHALAVARESQQLRMELEQEHGHSDKVTVVGISPAFRHVVEIARKVARTDASVFITGESGTGKELIARFIHAHSRRSSRALIPVNCAALPEALLESEMFGHVRGAFTGAVQEKPGLLEEANGGTLFLDELPEMSASIQAKLLRVLQDGVIRRVGSTKTNAVVNVRVIAATNRDPEAAIDAGTLREDLYYRLNVVPIHLPPLRERPEDVPVLARLFLTEYWKRHRDPGSPAPVLTEETIASLQRRPWPGNIRELQNVIEHAVVLLEPGAAVEPQDLPRLEDQQGSAHAIDGPVFGGMIDDLTEQKYHEARGRLLARFERLYLERLIERSGGNMSRGARLAGVDRTTLYRLMDKHGMTVQRVLETRSGREEA